MPQNKKAQEEMVGFILIVLVVAIVFVVFIGISYYGNKSEVTTESEKVSQFTTSFLKSTTDCAIGFGPPYLSVSQIIKACNDGKICTSGETACDVANRTIREMLNASWNVGPERPIEAYEFKSEYVLSDGTRNAIPSATVSAFSCTSASTKKGSSVPVGDKITIIFFICEKPESTI